MKLLFGCVLLGLFASAGAWAANARNPYGNVNHANDAGNDTGDAQVEALNRAQLSHTGGGSLRGYAPGPYGYAAPRPYYGAPVYAAPRPYYPAPVYLAPRPFYYYP